MNINGQRFIPAPRTAVWEALNDPQVLKVCIPGCESVEPAEDSSGYTVLMTAKVGPVSAKFKGRITLNDLNPPTSYRLAFDGQGGIAGFGKGTAGVSLSDVEEDGVAGTTLTYEAAAQVGGKLAQIGSRLIDATAAKMTDDFFGRFVKYFGPDVEVDPAAEESTSMWNKGKSWLTGGKEKTE